MEKPANPGLFAKWPVKWHVRKCVEYSAEIPVAKKVCVHVMGRRKKQQQQL